MFNTLHTYTYIHFQCAQHANVYMCRHAIHLANSNCKLYYSVVTPYNNIVIPAIVTLVMHCMGKLCLCPHKRSGNGSKCSKVINCLHAVQLRCKFSIQDRETMNMLKSTGLHISQCLVVVPMSPLPTWLCKVTSREHHYVLTAPFSAKSWLRCSHSSLCVHHSLKVRVISYALLHVHTQQLESRCKVNCIFPQTKLVF